MTCLACESRGLVHEDIVRKCLDSPAWVGRIFFNFDKLSSQFHNTLAEWFVKKIDAGKNRFLVLVPRDHLKTSLLSIATPTWMLLKNPNERILHTMATRREAQKTLSVIQKAFMSERMRHFFPERFLDPHDPEMKATRDMMVVSRPVNWREGSIESIGLDSNITGGHFTTQIFDDLIDKTMRNSITQQENAIDFLQDATNMLVDMEKDVRIIIGTLWEGEFYEWLLYKSGLASTYETLILGCFVDNRYVTFLNDIGKKTSLSPGDPIWPEEFSVKTLEQVKLEQGPSKFSRQFLNIPVEDKYKRFRRDDFLIYKLSSDRQYAIIGEGEDQIKFNIGKMKKYMVIDPATGEGKKTDETAISIVGVDGSGFRFVLEDWGKQCLPHETIDQIFYFADRWGVQYVCPEDVSYQKVFKHFLREKMSERGSRFGIRPVKPGNVSKGTRIEALEPYVRCGQVAITQGQLDASNGFVKEAEDVVIVRGMVQGRSPNRLDALSYQTEFWGVPKSRTLKISAEDEDIKDWDSLKERGEAHRAYGLACNT